MRHVAVDPEQLAAGRPDALFKLFVLQAMYQARRDVVIEKQQRGMAKSEDATLASSEQICGWGCGAGPAAVALAGVPDSAYLATPVRQKQKARPLLRADGNLAVT